MVYNIRYPSGVIDFVAFLTNTSQAPNKTTPKESIWMWFEYARWNATIKNCFIYRGHSESSASLAWILPVGPTFNIDVVVV